VPQDPNDEPASALLDCIRAERLLPKRKSSSRKKQTEGNAMTDAKQLRPLVEVLRERKTPLSREQLFKMSGDGVDSVDDFYASRKLRVDAGHIPENRSEEDTVLAGCTN
jgi:type I restriction enzyme S subunit